MSFYLSSSIFFDQKKKKSKLPFSLCGRCFKKAVVCFFKVEEIKVEFANCSNRNFRESYNIFLELTLTNEGEKP